MKTTTPTPTYRDMMSPKYVMFPHQMLDFDALVAKGLLERISAGGCTTFQAGGRWFYLQKFHDGSFGVAGMA